MNDQEKHYATIHDKEALGLMTEEQDVSKREKRRDVSLFSIV